MPERHHLDRDGPVASQAWHQFALIYDDQLAPRSLGDDLFAQQRAAAALDEVQLRVHFVGAVDRQVDAGLRFQTGQRDAEATRFLRHSARGRNADNVVQLTRRQQLAEAADGQQRGAAFAQAQHHARLHEVERAFGSLLLETLNRPRWLPSTGRSGGSLQGACDGAQTGGHVLAQM